MPQIIEFDKSRLPKTIKVSWVFEESLSKEWVESVPAHIKNKGEKRCREYAASRKALAQVSNLNAYEQLNIVNHSHLESAPHIKVSLSHTRGLSAAIASSEHNAVGIDIEFKDRIFKPEIAKFFKREEDIEIELIKLWSIKEAAFKALDPLVYRVDDKQVLVLRDLVVKHSHIEIQGKEVAKWNSQKHDGIITSVAWVGV